MGNKEKRRRRQKRVQARARAKKALNRSEQKYQFSSIPLNEFDRAIARAKIARRIEQFSEECDEAGKHFDALNDRIAEYLAEHPVTDLASLEVFLAAFSVHPGAYEFGKVTKNTSCIVEEADGWHLFFQKKDGERGDEMVFRTEREVAEAAIEWFEEDIPVPGLHGAFESDPATGNG